jgi:type I restriction enzyme S subunit
MKRYDIYKDSGIEWIGEIPGHWGIKKIKHRCYVKARVGWKGLKSDEFLSKGYAYLVTGSDFKNDSVDWDQCYHIDKERYDEDPYIQLQNEDLLITKDGTIGKLAIVRGLDKPACLNSGIFVVRPIKDDFSTEFLFWLLKSKTFTDFNGYTSYGSTIQHLYQNVFVEYAFPFPSLKEQTAIAHYLDRKTVEIDALIADKKRLLELYEEEKTAIINQAVTKGLNPDAPMRDSGIEWLGEVPVEWEVKKVKYVIESLNSIRVPLSADERGKMVVREYDYYGASGVIDKVEDYLFDEPLLLIGEDGANLITRSTRLSFIARGKYWVNNHAHILKPTYGLLEYYCELMELCDYSIWISGSAQPKLTSENLMNIQIIVPPFKEQKAIINHLKAACAEIDAKRSKTEKLINLLTEYRTTLISEVVTGKVKVAD